MEAVLRCASLSGHFAVCSPAGDIRHRAASGTRKKRQKGGFRLDRYLVVVAGAGLGGLTRYVAGTWITARCGGRFPLGSF